MKRFKIQAQFYVQAETAEDALDIATDMVNDAVSEQYERNDSVIVIGEVALEEDEDPTEPIAAGSIWPDKAES